MRFAPPLPNPVMGENRDDGESCRRVMVYRVNLISIIFFSHFMKPLNALNLLNYFSNQYKKAYESEYSYQGKGLEMTLLKQLMAHHDPYQIMLAMKRYIDNSMFVTVKDFYYHADEIIEEYADDPIMSKGWIALHTKPSEALREAYYEYLDECDGWFSRKPSIDKAAKKLVELSEEAL